MVGEREKLKARELKIIQNKFGRIDRSGEGLRLSHQLVVRSCPSLLVMVAAGSTKKK